MTNSADWYRLATYLQNEDATVTAIELLPGSGEEWYIGEGPNPHKPFLLSEGHLGIPEKTLYRAYAEAVRRHPSFRACPVEGDVASDALLCSSVILLLNPDHNSALNYRKNLVRDGHIDCGSELTFSSLVLMIPRNSKSSILWHHRRWLLEILHPLASSARDTSSLEWKASLPLERCDDELELAAQACERYRRNYYAWQHRAFLLQLIQWNIPRDRSSSGWTELLCKEHTRSTEWLETHVSDHSAAQYLCQIQKIAIELPVKITAHSHMDASALTQSVPWPIRYMFSLVNYYPDHETLWLGLRMACYITGSVGPEVTEVQQEVGEMLSLLTDDANEGETGHRDITSLRDRGYLHALRFVVWCRLENGKIFLDASLARRVLSVGDATSLAGCASEMLPS